MQSICIFNYCDWVSCVNVMNMSTVWESSGHFEVFQIRSVQKGEGAMVMFRLNSCDVFNCVHPVEQLFSAPNALMLQCPPLLSSLIDL